jgi:hypothetical protein
MAMIIRQELPAEDLEGISSFMLSDGVVDVPELTLRGTAVLDIITRGEPLPLKNVIVGRFVLHKEVDATTRTVVRETEEGALARHSDHMYGEDGPTPFWGVVVEDYEAPEDAFLVGVPL